MRLVRYIPFVVAILATTIAATATSSTVTSTVTPVVSAPPPAPRSASAPLTPASSSDESDREVQQAADRLVAYLTRAWAWTSGHRETLDVVELMIHTQRDLRDVVQTTRGPLDPASLLALGLPTWDLTVLRREPLDHPPTSSFGWREDPIHRRAKFHAGADFRSDRGTPVAAAGDGVVILRERQGGYGNVIYVDHGGGVVTRYAHLRAFEVPLHAAVTAGQIIGQVGSTGRSTGPHLHFEVRLDGRAVDPETALAIGKLQREAPVSGHFASFALLPERQANKLSTTDPPRSRPPRANTPRRVRPLS